MKRDRMRWNKGTRNKMGLDGRDDSQFLSPPR